MEKMQREAVDFRTPQQPSTGTNNWGGASPLLARDIPKESLEQKYIRLSSIQIRDEIFITDNYDRLTFNNDVNGSSSVLAVPKTILEEEDVRATEKDYSTSDARVPSRYSRAGFLSKLMMMPRAPIIPAVVKEKPPPTTLGGKKKRWFPRWDPTNRWPQGW